MSQATEPIPVQRLLDEAVRLTRLHFARVVPPVAVPMALAGGLAAALQIPTHLEQGTPDAWNMVLFVGSTLLALVAVMLGSGAIATASVDAVAGRPIEMQRAWLTFLRPRVVFTVVLAGLGTMLGMVCCLLPGIYLALLWSVVVPVMLEERIYGIEAMNRSAELMRHNPMGGMRNDPRFRAFMVLLAGFLLAYAVGFLVQLPLGVVMAVSMARQIAQGERADPQAMLLPILWLQIPTNMASMALQACTQLFSMLGVSVLYFDVRRRREGLDLEQGADQLGSAAAKP